jgi:SAM-dependent methyltransferase
VTGRSDDAFGQLVRDVLDGRSGYEAVERDDGLIMVNPARSYFAPVREWASVERRALRLMRGRVLDIGCGPGRLALELQRRGREVVAIDASPLAVGVARKRGVRSAHVCRLEDLDERFGRFDTMAMYGNNFGLFGGAHRSRLLLRRLSRLMTDRGRIIASSLDPYATDDPVHLAYQARNRSRGRMSGQVRLRVRHRGLCSPWFDYLLASREEMSVLADDGGWRLVRTIDGDGPLYVGVLERRDD